jgi:hypothetical protein
MIRSTSVVSLVVLAACPSSSSNSNPSTLWLAPDQNETHVKLVDSQPNIF